MLAIGIAVAVASMGATCQLHVKLELKNGHWVEHVMPDSTTYKTCEPGGTECIIADVSVN